MVANDSTSLHAPTEDGDEIFMQLSPSYPYPYHEYHPITFESDQSTAAPAAASNGAFPPHNAHPQPAYIPNFEGQPHLPFQSPLDPSLSYYGSLLAYPQWLANGLPLEAPPNPMEEPLNDFLNNSSIQTVLEKQQLSNAHESSYDNEISGFEDQSTKYYVPCLSNEAPLMDPYGSTSFIFPEIDTPGIAAVPSSNSEHPVLTYSAFSPGDHGSLSNTTTLELRGTQPPPQTPQKRQDVKRRPRTQRRGPLSSVARYKADSMRITGACWRCRRYRKPCNEALVCDNCLTSGFRIWPSEIGCYRGTLFDLAMPLMPGAAESAFQALPPYAKRPNWRRIQMLIPDHGYASGNNSQQLLWKVLGTRMFGKDFAELFTIVSTYQHSRKTKCPLIEASLLHLSATTNFYHAFISTDAWYPTPDLITTLQSFRSCSRVFWRVYIKVALSGRRSEWFSLFISQIIVLLSVVICTDAAFAMPLSLRNLLWRDLQETVSELRSRLYIAAINLINILTQKSRPLSLPYWNTTTVTLADGTVVKERNEQGMKMLGGDEATFDGIVAFKGWLDTYGADVERNGRIWFSNKPFTMESVRPIGVLSKLLYQ